MFMSNWQIAITLLIILKKRRPTIQTSCKKQKSKT